MWNDLQARVERELESELTTTNQLTPDFSQTFLTDA